MWPRSCLQFCCASSPDGISWIFLFSCYPLFLTVITHFCRLQHFAQTSLLLAAETGFVCFVCFASTSAHLAVSTWLAQLLAWNLCLLPWSSKVSHLARVLRLTMKSLLLVGFMHCVNNTCVDSSQVQHVCRTVTGQRRVPPFTVQLCHLIQKIHNL